jgi:hypothetical protein
MSTYGSDQCAFFLVGGRSLLGTQTSISVGMSNSIKDKTPLGVGSRVKAPTGLSEGKLTQSGWYEDDVGGSNEALVDTTGRTSQIMCVGFAGNVVGRAMIAFAGNYVASYNRGAEVDGFTKADAEYAVSGITDDNARILLPHAANTGTTITGTAVDHGAASALGAGCYLQISALALGGYTNVIFKVQHSTDNNTWVDLATFTAVTAAPAAERKAVAVGDVYQYLRATAAYTGTGTGQSVTAMVGVQRY